MRTLFIILFILFLPSTFLAQRLDGLTGIRDTSYSIASEYKKHIRKYPYIQPVYYAASDSVKVEMNRVYDSVNGHALKLDVFSPAFGKKKKKHPAILIIHGGGWRSGDKSMHHALAHALAKRGYVCITPEYRLSTEALYPAALHDLKTAMRWMRAHACELRIDTFHLVALGHSAGGQLAALMGATNGKPEFEGNGGWLPHRSEVQAVVDIDGVLAFIHPESGEGDDKNRVSAGTWWFGYTTKERPDIWQQASALTHVGPAFPPFLFLASSVDRMHAGRDDLIRQLNQYGIYAEQYTFDGAPHSFPLFHPWFNPLVEKIDSFLRR